MKVVQLQTPGEPEVLELVDRPVPQPAPGELRVQALAIGVGKPDALIRRGSYKWMPPLPAVPGNELAGRVDALGPGVDSSWLGRHVLVSSRELPQRGGCYVQAICVPAAAAYALPDGLDPADAVSAPNLQLAAALLYASGMQRPQSIVVHGAAGGVAHALLQLAQADGMLAIGTASSTDKARFARDAGALHVIDRSTQDVLQAVQRLTDGKGVDAVLDHVAGADFAKQLDLLAPLGTLLSYNALGGLPQSNLLGDLRRLLGRSLGVRCYSIHTLDATPGLRRSLMERAITLLHEGRVRAPPTVCMPLAEAVAAHRLLDSGDLLGKLVLTP
jgi:NADPH2:quinone reductase